MNVAFVIIAICLAGLSVYNWHKESEPFLASIRRIEPITGLLSALRAMLVVLVSIPRLLPLAADITITFLLVTNLGLTGGVVGATVALAMSNAIAYYIRKEMATFRARHAPEAVPTVTAAPKSS